MNSERSIEIVKLTPAQTEARETLRQSLDLGSVLALGGDPGRGKSTVLLDLHRELGGAMIKISDLLQETAKRHPLALEESAFDVIMQQLQKHHLVIVDDFDTLTSTLCQHGAYPRMHWFNGVCLALCRYAVETGQQLIVAYSGMLPHPMQQYAVKTWIKRFRGEDYQTIAANILGETGNGLNFEKIYRFAPKLNAYQLKAACEWLLHREPQMDTDKFIAYLRSQRLTSNVDLQEVQQVELHELVGVDDVIRSLEIHIALPLENDQLVNELSLRPKRGVLLYGPPGTGKTTVGRALAHRLKGKFFLIDGTFIAGTGDFYMRVHQVFEAAKENAPAVIFIDDADAIFEGGAEQGLYRYLLTMLDGLESESAGRICVMMTAMEVGHLPLALVRSGRVELWLEMKLPNDAARSSILQAQLAKSGNVLTLPDDAEVIAATQGFTGADLKRVVEDAKSLLAYDLVNKGAAGDASEYLLHAVADVALNKQRYAEAEQGARRPSQQGGGVNMFPGMHMGGGFFGTTEWVQSE